MFARSGRCLISASPPWACLRTRSFRDGRVEDAPAWAQAGLQDGRLAGELAAHALVPLRVGVRVFFSLPFPPPRVIFDQAEAAPGQKRTPDQFHRTVLHLR
jgi:hypothetical protein